MDIPDGAHGDAPSDYEIELEEIELEHSDNLDRFFLDEDVASGGPSPHSVQPGRRLIRYPNEDKLISSSVERIPDNIIEKLAEIKSNLSQFIKKLTNQTQAVILLDRLIEIYNQQPEVSISIQEQIVKVSRHLRDDELLEADILQGMLQMDKAGEAFAEVFKQFMCLRRQKY